MPATDWRKYLKFRCTGCGNCCRGTVVMITDDDVTRLVEGTGRDPRDFVRFYDQERVDVAKASPWWIRLGSKKAVMALRWQRGPRCTFLTADNRCTVYEHRPVACREHPFNVTLADSGALERMTISRIVECPHEWDGDISRREVTRIARWKPAPGRRLHRESEGLEPAPPTRHPAGFLRFLNLISAR